MTEAPKAEWLQRLVERDPSAARHLKPPDRPQEALWPPWSGFYREAFLRLIPDHPVGPMGDVGPLPFAALDRYARRYALGGLGFEFFVALMQALDDVYVGHVAARAREGLNDGQAGQPRRQREAGRFRLC